jgi:predicted transcriptional regulator
MTTHLESAQDLAVLLGERQADIMRLLWTHGPATVREIRAWLLPKAPLAYTTVMSLCVTLTEKGLLERHRVKERSRTRGQKAYLYAPSMSEAKFTRQAVEQRIAPMLAQYPALIQEQVTGTPSLNRTGSSDRAQVEHVLAYVGTLRDPQGQSVDAAALATIAALLERAEAAEYSAEQRSIEIQAAERRAAEAEQRAKVALGRAEWAEQQLEAARRQLNLPPKPVRKKPILAGSFQEYRDEAGICRVCGKPAPPPSAARQDGLRVCEVIECREEARRRDNKAKQRRYTARQSALRSQGEMVSA